MTLKEIREHRKLTQAEFAAKIQTHQANVSKWEAGVYTPSVRSLVLIAAILSCNIMITKAGIIYQP